MTERNWNQCLYIPFDREWREQSEDVRRFAINVEAGTPYAKYGESGTHHLQAQFATRARLSIAHFHNAIG